MMADEDEIILMVSLRPMDSWNGSRMEQAQTLA